MGFHVCLCVAPSQVMFINRINFFAQTDLLRKANIELYVSG